MEIINKNSAMLTHKLARELNGLKYIYDSYLDAAFNKVSRGVDLSDVDQEKVKTKACEILGLSRGATQT